MKPTEFLTDFIAKTSWEDIPKEALHKEQMAYFGRHCRYFCRTPS